MYARPFLKMTIGLDHGRKTEFIYKTSMRAGRTFHREMPKTNGKFYSKRKSYTDTDIDNMIVTLFTVTLRHQAAA